MMEFRTVVHIEEPCFTIEPLEHMLFVGSCFANGIGLRFQQERFNAVVNPYGTMYNPASVLHTIERYLAECTAESVPRVVFITLGTNHVYRLKETGVIVDNCEKRPQSLFTEEELTVSQCAQYLQKAVLLLRRHRPDVQVVLTVSPIRYRKYGYHQSQLSKATLLLAVNQLADMHMDTSEAIPLSSVTYFPAYEIVLDELRDYRFYKDDMLHPSDQAVEYIWQQLVDKYLSASARRFLQEWKPVKEALAHRPFHPESAEYQRFLADTRQREQELISKYSR